MPSPPPRRRFGLYRGHGLPPTVKALGTTSFFQDVASEMVYPLLPLFLRALGGGAVALGVMESVSEGVLAILKGAAGRWSDRTGRRKPFVSAGYGLSVLTRPPLAVAAAVWHVVGLRAVDRVAKGLRTAPRDAMIAETTSPDERSYAFAFHRGLDHLGAAVGPLLAALLLLALPVGDGSLRIVFALATVPALLGWLTVQLGTHETASGAEPRERRASAGSTSAEAARPRHEPPPEPPEEDTAARATAPEPPPSPGAAPPAVPRRLRRPLAAFFLFSLGNASDAFLLLAASDLGYSALGVTLLWSGFHVAKWLASAPGGRLADRAGTLRVILGGWAVYALVYLGFAAASGGGAGWLPPLLAVYALYYGLTEGAEKALVVSLAEAGSGAGGGAAAPAPGAGPALGSVLGAFHLATGLGTFGASLLFGFLYQTVSPAAAFVTGAGLAVAAAGLLAVAGGRISEDGSGAGRFE